MPRKGPHPVRFAILIAPYGMAFGVVANAISVLATRAGIPEADFGGVIASVFLFHSLKPFWGPLVDSTLSRKTWYVIGNLLTAFGTVAMMAMPFTVDGLRALQTVILVAQFGVSVVAMACEGFLALAVPEEEKGSASGWYNAGIFLALGLGGWFMLKLAEWLPARWMAGAIFAGVMLPCTLALIGLEVARTEKAGLGGALVALGRDLSRLVRSRFSLTGLLICLTPVGAGAVQNLFPVAADHWGIVETYQTTILGVSLNANDVIGLFNGFAGAALTAAGALLGGWLADRIPRRLAYAGAGFALALTAIAMALAPREPWAWIVFSGIYNFFTGLALAALTSFVLEAIGKGAVATKYNIFAACANFAIYYTTKLDARALGAGGPSAMLYTDAGLTLAGCTLLVVVFLLLRTPPPATSSSA